MTAKLELIIQAGKVEMRIMSNSDTEEKEALKIRDRIKKEVKKIEKKVSK